MLFCCPCGFLHTFTSEMLYIPERDSCPVWTANNIPLQRGSETLYWLPSSSNIDGWQVQSAHDDDTLTWYNNVSLSRTVWFFVSTCTCSLCGARQAIKHKSLFCQSIQGCPAHSPSTRRKLRAPLAKNSSSHWRERRTRKPDVDHSCRWTQDSWQGVFSLCYILCLWC